MSRLGSITRRTFLIGSAAIAGGVAFGTYVVRKPIENPLLNELADGEAAITPYVKISSDGVTLTTPRADKGQGAYSIQAFLLAEELDIDPRTAVTPGLPGPAYYNGALLSEGVPFPAYDEGMLAESVRSFMELPARLLKMQVTGGSSTVPDMYEKLRTAGAVARETLKQAASLRTDIDRSELRTDDGHVILPDETRIAYTELAVDAARITPIQDVALREPANWRWLGRADLQRTDMQAKCTGTEVYGIDKTVENMRFASVRTNPANGGGIVSYDASRAETMPGVEAVVPLTNGVGVIASNTWYAIQAVNTIECTWDKSPYPASSADIKKQLEAALDNPDHFDHRQRNEGNVDTSLDADDRLQASYEIPFLAHAPLEPMNATVRVTDDTCTIWTGTQIPLFVRDRVAHQTGLDPEQIRVHVQRMGGSFGHRLELTHILQAVELAQAVKGTPVKMTWSREEDMTHDYPRPAALAQGRGLVANGKVLTLDLSVSQSALTPKWLERLTGMSVPGPDATITTGSWDQPFAIPNYRVTGYRAKDMVPVSSWRAVGASGNGFFHDTFLDELIHAAGADALEERIRLCHHDASRKVLEAVGELSNWSGSQPGENLGVGVAFCLSFGVPVAEVVKVSNTDQGIKLDKAYIVADVGKVLDPVNCEAQLFGGFIYGISHAIYGELQYENGTPVQNNFHTYRGLRLNQTPDIEVRILENGSKIRGIGEPGLPPAAPALGNAIFAATGQRIRALPFNKHVSFV